MGCFFCVPVATLLKESYHSYVFIKIKLKGQFFFFFLLTRKKEKEKSITKKKRFNKKLKELYPQLILSSSPSSNPWR